MTAWAKLLAASSLLTGTAWQLISSPKTGGAGVVVNSGVGVELSAPSFNVEVVDMTVEVEVTPVAVSVLVADNVIVVELEPTSVAVEVLQ